MNNRQSFVLALAAALAIPVAAQAHVLAGEAHYHGFSDGLMHVATGIDHLVIAALVGLWAAWRPARAGMGLVAVYGAGLALAGLTGLSGEFVSLDLLVGGLALSGVLAALRTGTRPLGGALLLLTAGVQGTAHGMAAASADHGSAFIAGVTAATVAAVVMAAFAARRFAVRGTA
jgi:urease accessory protein